MAKASKLLSWTTVETGLRIWAAFNVCVYGFGKVVQFEGGKLSHVTIQNATGFEIMWGFFGATKAYPIMIGCVQVLGALLLIFDRTKLLGALLLSPIFLNIIVLDILYEISPGALMNAVFFQSVFLFVIIKDWRRIMIAVQGLIIPSAAGFSFVDVMLKYLMACGLAAGLFFGFRAFTNYFTFWRYFEF